MTESGGVSKQFDPRFSPAFQPGYDPRVHREEPPRGPLRDDPASSSSGIAPGFPDFAVPEPELDPAANAASLAVPSAAASVSAAEGEADVRAWWQRINPWIIGLWVLGILFIGAGIGTVFAAAAWQRGGGFGGEDGYYLSILLQVVFLGAPMLVVLGLATLTSSVAIFALRWKR